MKKNELRKLRALTATPGMITTMKKGECRYFVRAQNLEGYVKIAVFHSSWLKNGIKTPCWEVFVNKEGEEWISRSLDQMGNEGKWSEAMIFNLNDKMGFEYWNRWSQNYWVTPDTFETLRRFGKRPYDRKHCLNYLDDWQDGIHKARIAEQEQTEQQAWDEDMKLIPKTPKGLSWWMHRECNKDFYLIYEYKPGQKKAFCSKCGEMVEINGLKNEKEARCPKCHAKAACKPAGRLMQNRGTRRCFAHVIQKIKGGVVERIYEQHETYRGRNYWNPKVFLDEQERILIMEDGTTKRYYWGSYKNKKIRWCKDRNWEARTYRTYGSIHSAKVYPPTLREARKSPVLAKSSYALWKEPPLNLTEFLVVEKGNPAVEMCGKIKMFHLAEDLIHMRYDKDILAEDETELAKLLKIDNARLKRLRTMGDVGVTALKWMQREKATDVIWPDELIRDMDAAKIAPKDLAFLPHKILSEVQVWNYLKKQGEICGEGLWQTMRTWDDYLSMAGSYKMDVKNTRILKPKDVKLAHDELVILKRTNGMEQEAKKIEKKWPKVKGQLAKLKKFEFKDKKYCILAPESILDIVREGKVLQHCVHTCDYYFQRIINDESYLFFLRKTDHPEVPWYTLEVEPSGNIRQKRTTGDRQNRDFETAVEFLKKWQQYFGKKLTKEEKELGIVANKLRKKNYEELREQKKRVWHGPLAGKLLADVLEADFMEAT